jgi:hypothetical protein
MIYPQLYGQSDDLNHDIDELQSKLRTFRKYFDSDTLAAIRDTSFPNNFPDTDLHPRALPRISENNSEFVRLLILHPSENAMDKLKGSLILDHFDNHPLYEAIIGIKSDSRRLSWPNIEINGCDLIIDPALMDTLRILRQRDTNRVLSFDTGDYSERPIDQEQMETSDIIKHATRALIKIPGMLPGTRGELNKFFSQPSNCRQSSMADIVQCLFGPPGDENPVFTEDVRAAHIELCRCFHHIESWKPWSWYVIAKIIIIAKDVLFCWQDITVPWADLSQCQEAYAEAVLRRMVVLPFHSQDAQGKFFRSQRACILFQTLRLMRLRYQAAQGLRIVELVNLLRHIPTSLDITCQYGFWFFRDLIRAESKKDVNSIIKSRRPEGTLTIFLINTLKSLDVLGCKRLNLDLLNLDRDKTLSWALLKFRDDALCANVMTQPEGQMLYNADAREHMNYTVNPEYCYLTCRGVSVDTIDFIIDLHVPVVLDRQSSRTGYWRAIFTARDRDVASIEHQYQTKGDEAFDEICWRTVTADQFLSNDLTQKRIPAEQRMTALGRCWTWPEDFQVCLCLFVTKSGMLGRSLCQPLPGDDVVILFGCSLPFLIRESTFASRRDYHSAGTYRVVESWYVSLVMWYLSMSLT